MSEKIINFIKYNNAFTIILGVCFLGSGVTFAYSTTVRDAVQSSIYTSSETVTSVDNGLIISTNLDNFDFMLKINSITEDGKNYYAVYSYQTLMIEDGAWKVKNVEKTLTVNKEALDGKDLGLYASKELGDNINYELSYLKRVQKLEREKGESQKVVTTEYSGLIGKLLDPKEQVIEGYNPVIPEEVTPEVSNTVELKPEPEVIPLPSTPSVPDLTPVTPVTPVTPAPSASESTSTPVLESATSTPQATSTPATTTPEVIPEPVATSTPATTTPEVIPEPEVIPPTPEVITEPVADTTPTPEIVPEPVIEEPTSTTTTP
jgi:hypothetical protein